MNDASADQNLLNPPREWIRRDPAPAAAPTSAFVYPKQIDAQYWTWNDARRGGENISIYSGPWGDVLKAIKFQGTPTRADPSGIYQDYEVYSPNPYGGEDVGSQLDFSPEAYATINKLRAAGYDLRQKHPDRRTYNTYWGFVTPDGQVQDIKIEGDDGWGNLLKIALFLSPVWAGPLASLLSVPTPVVSIGTKLITGQDPVKAVVSTLAPIAVDAVLPSVSVLPDTSIGPILPPDEWLDAPFVGPVMPGFGPDFMGPVLPTVNPGFVVPTLPVTDDALLTAELLTAPALLPELDPIETLGPTVIPPPPVYEPPPVLVYEPEPLPFLEPPPPPVFEPEPLPFYEPPPPVYEPPPPVYEPEPPPVYEPEPPPVYEPEPPPVFEPEPPPVYEPPAPPVFEPPPPPVYETEPIQFEPVPVVDLPAIETMTPIPTIDTAPPTIEPVEVFTQPIEVPKMDEFYWGDVDIGGPAFDVDFSDPFAGGDFTDPVYTLPVADYGFPDEIYGPPAPGETYPPAYDVVTVDDAAQLSADILVGGSGGGLVEVGGNFAPNPDPGNPGLSVGQVLRDANGIMLEALKLVDSYRRLVNPQPPNRVTQARVGSSTVRATPDGMIVTVDASGRTVRTKPPVGQPQMTTDGSMIVNNGDGTYTSISPSGAMATNRYPTTGAAAASSNYTTPLLIGGAILALVALTR
jgi:hypothetical protein